MNLNKIICDSIPEQQIVDRKHALKRIADRLEWISFELNAIHSALHGVLVRPELPRIIDSSEHLNVAVFRRLKLNAEDFVFFEKELLQTESEHIAAYPNWELQHVFIAEQKSDKAVCLRTLIEEAKQGSIDLIITDSASTFSDDPAEALQFVNTLRTLSHPVHVLFEREQIYTKTDYDALVRRVKHE